METNLLLSRSIWRWRGAELDVAAHRTSVNELPNGILQEASFHDLLPNLLGESNFSRLRRGQAALNCSGKATEVVAKLLATTLINQQVSQQATSFAFASAAGP
jgi:hypothetical protein